MKFFFLKASLIILVLLKFLFQRLLIVIKSKSDIKWNEVSLQNHGELGPLLSLLQLLLGLAELCQVEGGNLLSLLDLLLVGIEINQYNCPIECYDEAVIEEMTEDREMLTNPDLVEARKDLKTARGENPLVAQKMMTFDPSKSNILSTLAAEEGMKVSRTA